MSKPNTGNVQTTSKSIKDRIRERNEAIDAARLALEKAQSQQLDFASDEEKKECIKEAEQTTKRAKELYDRAVKEEAEARKLTGIPKEATTAKGKVSEEMVTKIKAWFETQKEGEFFKPEAIRKGIGLLDPTSGEKTKASNATEHLYETKFLTHNGKTKGGSEYARATTT